MIEIEEPTRSERTKLAERIYSNAVKGMRLQEFVDVLPDGIVDRAADSSPREFKRLSQMAVGRALARGDTQPQPEDFAIQPVAQKRQIGF